MLGTFVLSGGGDNLNFRVLGGTSAPVTPKERDIWVNTATAITSWDFSPTQPLRRSSNANLLVYPYASGASLVTNGITFSCNSSGHVTVSGTATANAYYRVHNDTAGVMYLEPGTYTLSGCPAQPGSGNSYYLYLYDIDNGRTLGSDYGSSITVTLSARTHVSVSICVLNGKTASSAVFKPKLEKAAAATAYVKGDATGQVWVKTGDTGDASLNALEKNGIWLNLSGARQYVDGAWSEVPSKVYLNGAWVELKSNLYLCVAGIPDGDFIISTTPSGPTAFRSMASPSSYSIAGSELSISLANNNRAGCWVVTEDSYSAAEYSTINVSSYFSSYGGNENYVVVAALAEDLSTVLAYAELNRQGSDAASSRTISLDISGLASGTCRFAIGACSYLATAKIIFTSWEVLT